MSTVYEEFGRTRQKARTRSQLIAAARALIAAGTASPTVEQAAEAASVSRTTAYRYFPSQKALLIAAHPEIQTSSLLPDEPGDDPATRLALAIEKFVGLVLESEGQQRTMLRLSLESDAHGPSAAAGPGDRLVRGCAGSSGATAREGEHPSVGGGYPQRGWHRVTCVAHRRRWSVPGGGRATTPMDRAGVARTCPR